MPRIRPPRLRDDRATPAGPAAGDLAGQPEYHSRFSREAELAARLNDPHVIPIHRYGEISGRLYLDMRLVEGMDLAALVDAGPPDPAEVGNFVDQVGGRAVRRPPRGGTAFM